MAKQPAAWVHETTLGSRSAPFWWRLGDAGAVSIMRVLTLRASRKQKVIRAFSRDELEQLLRLMADGEWHASAAAVTTRKVPPPAGSIAPFLRHALGRSAVEAAQASHLGLIFTQAGLWEWNQQRRQLRFRQISTDLGQLEAYYARRQKSPGPRPPSDREVPTRRRRGRSGPAPPGFTMAASFQGRAAALRGSLEAIGGGRHGSEKGHRREAVLHDFLRDHLPPQYGIARGEVATYWGEISPQIDIIIYDVRAPLLLKGGDSTIVPIESVYAAIELKPLLDRPLLRSAAKGLRRVKAMRAALHPPSRQHPPVFTAIIACQSDSQATVARTVRRLHEGKPPSVWLDCVWVLDTAVHHLQTHFPGPAAWDPYAVDEHTPFVCAEAGVDSLLYFYILLMRDLEAKTLPPLDLALYAQGINFPEPKEL